AVVGDPRLVIARLTIALVQLRGAKSAPDETRRRLGETAQAVFAPLANRLGVWQLKWELEDLAFRYLEPEEYRRIAAALNEKRGDRERYISELCELLRSELARVGIVADVHGRPKHIYSIWRKMQRKSLAFAELFDVRAVRIVVGSIPDCYGALGVVHSRWHYIPGEFDDYIATPKDNFYRSIHTAVIGPENKPVEVQIRSREMHEHSELGVAAHWRYKEGGARDTGYEKKIEWVRRLLEPAEARDGDRDFIDRVRSELFEDRVYALTPKGEVVDLPRGATPLDFAYQVHTDLGHRCRGAKVNGRIVPLSHHLANGEVVEIITGREPAPSRDWLAPEQRFLASPRSRAKVRAWFRRQNEVDNRTAGREILERELARLGAAELLPALVQELKARDADQLYRLLGEGELSATQLVHAAERLHTARRAVPGVIKPRRAPKRRAAPIEVEGLGDLSPTLARCCTPMRPQPVAGYVTLGRGVTVHRANCPGFLRMSAERPERVLAVRWSADPGVLLPAEVVVLAYDRRGLVRDLTDILAEERLSIDSMTTTTDHAEQTARVVMRFAVPELEALSRVLRRLSAVSSVLSARRSG
ncbi:MAG TPA: bifunctional (p)ppGpp synthetase/guanosine-3',5'-bis(diphosphate) 3'-pyrophosphohydrolase, partial [Steroidobacteraceae bacterium]